jgi:hypothetical protein
VDNKKPTAVRFSIETDAVTRFMAKHNMPYTRANYLAVAFLGDVPKEIDPEVESMIPDDLKLRHHPDDWEEIE